MNSPFELLGNKIQPEEIERVQQSIEHARGMPNVTYTDDSLFKFERDYIFGANWSAIEFAHALKMNEIKPLNFMGLPLLITKDKRGEIKVFHNVCSHRGVMLVDEQKKTNGLIICPYHSWTYSLGGELKATPHIGGTGVHKLKGFSCAERGLREVPSHVWLGIVFVNINTKAKPFEQEAAKVMQYAQSLMGGSGEQLMQPCEDGDVLTIDVKCNWKLAVENYLEAYHLPFIHPDLNAYSPLEKHRSVIHGERLAGQISDNFDLKLETKNPLPLFSDWDPQRLQQGNYPVFYPNLLLGFQSNHLFAMIIRPTTATTSLEELALFYVSETAVNEEYLGTREHNLKAWRQVFSEDIEPCERMQMGRCSPGYQGGTFSPVLDKCSHHFHQWIAAHYEEFFFITN